MNTFYGGMWQLTTDGFNVYKDLAYTHGRLAVHTDNTYCVEPAGYTISRTYLEIFWLTVSKTRTRCFGNYSNPKKIRG